MQTPPVGYANRTAVLALYRILLGRHPESEAIIETHRGRPLAAFIGFTLQSPEFRRLARLVATGHPLPHPQVLSVADLNESAAWIAQLGEPVPEESNWWTMIGIVFARAPQSAVAEYRSFADHVTRRAHVTTILPTVLGDIGAFDAEWYRRSSRGADIAVRDGTVPEVQSYFLESGRTAGEQLLAHFSERLTDIYQCMLADATIDDVAAATVRAANRGMTGHWLFSEHYYTEMHRAAGDGAPDDGGVPYVDFLARRTSEAVKPHPLFCPHSYAQLNNLADGDATFDHYVRYGLFDGLQTSALFEPSFYAELNPQARIDILKGKARNELHHFLTFGILDDSRFSPFFDADFYLAAYPDVGEQIAAGIVPSATWHFIHHGLSQDRSPSRVFNADYYQTRYPHVRAEIAAMKLGSALEHYLLVGRSRDLLGDVPMIERRAALDDGKVILQRRALRSLDRQSRKPLTFPSRPDLPIGLSVIVPVCGRAYHTARLLECAQYAAGHLITTLGVAAQLIMVDNGSRDETGDLLAATTGITVVRHCDPIGYPRAIAAGIRQAKGDLVLVSNNDLEFEPDAFVRILEQLTSDPTIGILGGLVVLPNERLQDAGSFVDHEGFTVGVGRHEAPWSAFVRGLREVDYCAGCFFAFRLEDYWDVGGVDERFSPGYYEEVDFAFRMREQLGKRTVVDSDLQVVHFEHGSFGDGSTPVAAEPVIRRNRAIFLTKHARALADRPSHADLLHDDAARPLGIARPRALVIVQKMPAAGGAWPARLLDGMNEAAVPFEILALEADPDRDAYADRRVNVLRGWMPGCDPLETLRRSAGRFSHIILAGVEILRQMGPQLARTVDASGVRLICDVGPLSVLTDIERFERAGLVAIGEDERIGLVRAAIAAEPDVALWLASNEHERRILLRAGARRAVTIAQSGQHNRRIHIALVGCGAQRNDVAFDDVLGWCRSSVLPAVPGAATLAFSAILRSDIPDTATVSIGLPPTHDVRTDCTSVIAVIPPHLNDIGEVRRILASGLPVLMTDRHRHRLEDELGVASGRLAIVDDDDSVRSYAAWFSRLATEPSLIETTATAQRAWVVGKASCSDEDDPRLSASG